jgi:Bacterial PH domain
MSEYEVEPVRGLPEHLPAGERVLWQGAPDWWGLAKRAFHVRMVAIYGIALLAWHGLSTAADGASLAAAASKTLFLAPLPLALVGVLLLLAWLFARSTVYTITNRRVVMRFGVALPMTINLPFKRIRSAALKVDRKGIGDLPLALVGDDRIAWLHLWPHARPWRIARPEPMLRALPEAAKVAEILAAALVGTTAARSLHGSAETAARSVSGTMASAA